MFRSFILNAVVVPKEYRVRIGGGRGTKGQFDVIGTYQLQPGSIPQTVTAIITRQQGLVDKIPRMHLPGVTPHYRADVGEQQLLGILWRGVGAKPIWQRVVPRQNMALKFHSVL